METDVKRHRFDPWVRKSPWRRDGNPLRYFCLENPHGQRSLAGYSPWGCKELDMTESTWSTCRHINIYLSIHERENVAQSSPTLCDPMDYTVHGILQARILEWAAFPFSRGSPQPRDRTQVSHIAGRFFTSRTTREALGPLIPPNQNAPLNKTPPSVPSRRRDP